MSQSAFIHIASVMRSVTTCNIPSDLFLQLTRGDFLPESWLQRLQPKWLLLCCRQFDSWILKGSLQKSKCRCSLNCIQFFGNSINIILKKVIFKSISFTKISTSSVISIIFPWRICNILCTCRNFLLFY